MAASESPISLRANPRPTSAFSDRRRLLALLERGGERVVVLRPARHRPRDVEVAQRGERVVERGVELARAQELALGGLEVAQPPEVELGRLVQQQRVPGTSATASAYSRAASLGMAPGRRRVGVRLRPSSRDPRRFAVWSGPSGSSSRARRNAASARFSSSGMRPAPPHARGRDHRLAVRLVVDGVPGARRTASSCSNAASRRRFLLTKPEAKLRSTMAFTLATSAGRRGPASQRAHRPNAPAAVRRDHGGPEPRPGRSAATASRAIS